MCWMEMETFFFMSHGHKGLIWFNMSRIVHETAQIAPKLTKTVRKIK